MSKTTVTSDRSTTRLRRAGHSLKSVLDEMVAARDLGRGRPRR